MSFNKLMKSLSPPQKVDGFCIVVVGQHADVAVVVVVKILQGREDSLFRVGVDAIDSFERITVVVDADERDSMTAVPDFFESLGVNQRERAADGDGVEKRQIVDVKCKRMIFAV